MDYREVTAALGKVGRLLLFICHLVNQENVASVANLATCRHEVPSAPPLGELLSVSEAEGVRLGERTTSNIVPSNGRHSLSQPVRADSSLREGAKGASHQRIGAIPAASLEISGF